MASLPSGSEPLSSQDRERAGPQPAGRGEPARASAGRDSAERRRRSARLKVLLIVALCAAPTIAAYLAYFVVRPAGRTNYGELVEPQRSVDELGGATDAGRPFRLGDLHGRWILLALAPGPCDAACERRLWIMRQVRLTTGRERDRVERVVLTGSTPLPAALLDEHPGLVVARARGRDPAAELPVPDTSRAADHLWVVDPLGHLIMRYPADVDPNRMKKDLARLLKNSRIG